MKPRRAYEVDLRHTDYGLVSYIVAAENAVGAIAKAQRKAGKDTSYPPCQFRCIKLEEYSQEIVL